MTTNVDLKINNFEGPLDLLLQLVREKKVDIFSIDLVEVSTQYISIINVLKDKNIDLASEYLLMASILIQIKSRIILEGPEKVKESKEVKDILKQLAEYQQFKNISKELRKKEELRKNFFIKTVDNFSKYNVVDETKLDGSSDALKLITILKNMFKRISSENYRKAKIDSFNLSPVDRRLELLEIMNQKEKVCFEDFFKVPTINHFVVTMITVLDMVNKGEVILKQKEQFGNIEIRKGIENE